MLDMVMVPKQTSLEIVEVVEWLKEVGLLVAENIYPFCKFCHCLSLLGNSSLLIFFEQLLALSIILSPDPVFRSPDQARELKRMCQAVVDIFTIHQNVLPLLDNVEEGSVHGLLARCPIVDEQTKVHLD
jgi:hypothetical protein